MHEKLGAYSGGIRAATSQFSGAGEGGPKLIAFEADVTNVGPAGLAAPITFEVQVFRKVLTLNSISSSDGRISQSISI